MLEEKSFLIVFASQTGTSEDVAAQLAYEANLQNYSTAVISFEELSWDMFMNTKRIVFICSTTGIGDPPDNMKAFWKLLLRRSLSNSLLKNHQVAVFGLGDSKYEKFNFVAKRLYRRLIMLGAQLWGGMELGLGDDQYYLGVNGIFDQWKNNLFKTIEPKSGTYSANDSSSIKIDDEPNCIYKLLEKQDDSEDESHSSDMEGEIVEKELLTDSNYEKKVVKILLLPKENSINGTTYVPGDFVSIRPRNDRQSSMELLELLGFSDCSDKLYKVERNIPPWALKTAEGNSLHPSNKAKKLVDIIEEMVDLNAIPKRMFFIIASKYAALESEREKLAELGSAEGLDLYWSYIVVPKRNVLETLQDFPSLKGNVPIGILLDILPRMYKRSYSISNYDPKTHQVRLTVAVVNYKKHSKMPPRLGTCSNYLLGLELKSKVFYSLHRGTMDIPSVVSKKPNVQTHDGVSNISDSAIISNSSYPIIMIGPGTGIAPFMSFLEYRKSHGIRDNVMFFGCRYKKKDYLYQEELKQYVDSGFLKLFTAFSRDVDQVRSEELGGLESADSEQKTDPESETRSNTEQHLVNQSAETNNGIDSSLGSTEPAAKHTGERKTYVQHLILQQSPLVYDLLINKKAHVYVAGRLNSMPDQVFDAFASALTNNDMSQNSAKSFLESMKKSKKYQVECWE
ncbi:hypothetical protein BB560_002928 [Smittium megazygosporum]|uniref:NADPH-dependent diflavin oxidoreductase 1 n=1 Tax=Smittium megazygosporum TaxID=133381 RepID=A0A2T9ZDF6_9FUNG|nr:hypothetical protein BB560_002928 [Smittium megazygosporum]